VQAGVGTKFILEEAAASFQLPVLTADEVLAAPGYASGSQHRRVSLSVTWH
jgi:hypothetical protein